MGKVENKELAEYLKNRMKGCRVKGLTGDYLYMKAPIENELEFWIQQFKTLGCERHSEWSERYQRNIWVSDYDEE